MERIDATLPALGAISIDFHKESAEVLNMMGDKEMERLRRVPHLGIASAVFTGVNHSRLEYMLMQCAVLALISKLHKGNSHFALASPVKLNGIAEKISSGEELLKCWALLGNFGHTQDTYGVERSLMIAASTDKELFRWITECKYFRDLRDWSRRVIREYDDSNMHHVVAVKRLQTQKPTRYVNYIRNLVLPPHDLFPKDHTAQHKIRRLRGVFNRVRRLCMATLDSYYSHHPLTIQLSSAILNISNFADDPDEETTFERILTETNALLAEGIYLHPKACSTLRAYELRGANRIQERFARNPNREQFFAQLLNDGITRAEPSRLVPLMRLTGHSGLFLAGSNNTYQITRLLEKKIVAGTTSKIAVNRNAFNGEFYVDVLYRSNVTPPYIALLIRNLSIWLIDALRNVVDRRIRSIFGDNSRNTKRKVAFRQVQVDSLVLRQYSSIIGVFNGFLSYLLPKNYQLRITEFSPISRISKPVLVKFDSGGFSFDNVTPTLNTIRVENPLDLDEDRLHEIQAVERIVTRSKANFVLVCIEKCTVHDVYHSVQNPTDELDGVIMEIFSDSIRLTIVEAKNYRHATRSENKALDQLEGTRKRWQLGKRGLTYRTQRIKGMGALLRYSLDLPR